MASLFPSAGPNLPHFNSLLITGKYHASAPIHLCLSHALQADAAKVVLVVASRPALAASLAKLRDEWIEVHGGEGRTVGAASKVQVLYPPGVAHLNLLLSLFHGALTGEEDFLHEKTTFATIPSLLVLCDLSSYFKGMPEAIVSSYLTLLIRALTAANSLSAQSGRRTSLAIFDSGLESLRLPLVRAPSPDPTPEGNTEGQSLDPPIVRREALTFIMQRYTEWVGVVEEESPNKDEDEILNETDVKRVCTLRLQRVLGSEMEEHIQRWTERQSIDGATLFTWPL